MSLITETLRTPEAVQTAYLRMMERTERVGACLVFTGARQTLRGEKWYGVVRIGGKAGRTVLAHRLAWEARHGPIPDGLCVCHHCDNPPCLEDAHHFLGTKADNSADMKAKGRAGPGDAQLRGADAPWSRLTDDDVRAIRRAAALRLEPQRVIGQRFGVSQAMVSAIHLRQLWAHVT